MPKLVFHTIKANQETYAVKWLSLCNKYNYTTDVLKAARGDKVINGR